MSNKAELMRCNGNNSGFSQFKKFLGSMGNTTKGRGRRKKDAGENEDGGKVEIRSKTKPFSKFDTGKSEGNGRVRNPKGVGSTTGSLNRVEGTVLKASKVSDSVTMAKISSAQTVIQGKVDKVQEAEDETFIKESSMGGLNGVQHTGNVQNKVGTFSRMNSQSQSSRTHVSSSSASHQQSNMQQMEDLNTFQSKMKEMKQMSAKSSSRTSSVHWQTQSYGSNLKDANLKNDMRIPETNSENGDLLDSGRVQIQEVFPSENDVEINSILNSTVDRPNHALESPNLVKNNQHNAVAEPSIRRFEQKSASSSSHTKIQSSSFSTEKALTKAAGSKRVSAGDVHFEQKESTHALRQKVEVDGVKAEKMAAIQENQKSLTQAGITEEQKTKKAAALTKLSTDQFTAEDMALLAEQQKKTMNHGTVINSEKRVASASQSRLAYRNGTSIKSLDTTCRTLDDLDALASDSSEQDREIIIDRYSSCLTALVENIREPEDPKDDPIKSLDNASKIIRKAWLVPDIGHEVGDHLCDTLRTSGGLDILIGNCDSSKDELKFASARLLEQSLTPQNCQYVVEKGYECLDKVVKVASDLCEGEESSVGTGLLRHLFRLNEATCSDILRLKGLERVMAECRRLDVETLRNCAGALVNLSLFGGAENQEAMIKNKVHLWLFPLAFHNDDSVKYYACLAIAVLVANKEIEAQIIKSNVLQLVEPFLNSHDPEKFAACNSFHSQGQNKQWLKNLLPVLSSQREEARSLAAFHFRMEAGIKKRQNMTHIFGEIDAIEPLKQVASLPNALASKYAAQALKIIGEDVPHKLSQQVPLWSAEDVREWVIQKEFYQYADSFQASRVDGDLLLQLTEEMLREDIKMENGILRKRFMRDLDCLKRMADYSSVDPSNLNDFLSSIHPDFSVYTYTLLYNHIDKDALRKFSHEDNLSEYGVKSSVHRRKIMDAVKEKDEVATTDGAQEKPLDVFISYRRSNGSQLASLLKVHLQLRGFKVFIDVERLEAGKFDNNLLHSIKNAKHFLLVLTPNALDRCLNDKDCKDWVHREIKAAIESNCNIIPIIDNFHWPEAEHLPEDMNQIASFNGIRWIHDYQDACVDKLERFLKGELIPSESDNNKFGSDGSNSSSKSYSYQRTFSHGSE